MLSMKPSSNSQLSPAQGSDHPASPESAFLGTAALPVGHAQGLPEGSQAPKLRDFSLDPTQNTSKFDLDRMNQADLLALRAKIDSKITGLSLNEVNLPKEALIQLQSAKLLQQDATLEKKNIPMNQRASVQNSLANIIKDLGKMQAELYNSEYTKRLKAAVVKVVKSLPKEAQVKFFEQMDMEAELIEAEMSGA